MIKRFINNYYELLDEKLENGTIVVLLIASLIISISFITKPSENNIFYVKSNILERKNHVNNQTNFIEIEGVKYKIILEKILD